MTVVSTTGRVHIRGPLAGYVEGFEAELTRLGFAPASVVNQLHLVAHLSRWLDAQRLAAEDLTVERIETFIGERRAAYTALFSHRALRPLLGWLATSGVIAAEVASPRRPDDPAVLARFEEYLLSERRLQAGTTAAHMARVRRFLNGYAPPGGLAELTAAEVTRALLDEGEGRAPVSVKKYGYALRAFLRFCLVTGEVEHNLTGATLVIRSPQPSLLPVGVSPAQIEALLEACDRDTLLGRREYAVIVLLARLGLRAGEVAGLRLEDIANYARVDVTRLRNLAQPWPTHSPAGGERL